MAVMAVIVSRSGVVSAPHLTGALLSWQFSSHDSHSLVGKQVCEIYCQESCIGAFTSSCRGGFFSRGTLPCRESSPSRGSDPRRGTLAGLMEELKAQLIGHVGVRLGERVQAGSTISKKELCAMLDDILKAYNDAVKDRRSAEALPTEFPPDEPERSKWIARCMYLEREIGGAEAHQIQAEHLPIIEAHMRGVPDSTRFRWIRLYREARQKGLTVIQAYASIKAKK
jgi:hypothetical protein